MTGTLVFTGRYAAVFPENPDEIAQIVESAAECRVRNGIIAGLQQNTCLFNPVIVQVVDGGSARQLLKKVTEIFGRHSGFIGQIV